MMLANDEEFEAQMREYKDKQDKYIQHGVNEFNLKKNLYANDAKQLSEEINAIKSKSELIKESQKGLVNNLSRIRKDCEEHQAFLEQTYSAFIKQYAKNSLDNGDYNKNFNHNAINSINTEESKQSN